MEITETKNGFYWIIIKHEGDEPEVAEFIDGQWYVAGSSRSFCPDIYEIELLSDRLIYPP